MLSLEPRHRRQDGLKRRLQRLYPERQVLLRSRGRVRFVALSPATQIGMSLVLLLVAAGMMYGMVSYALQERTLAAKDSQILQAERAYQSVLGELSTYEWRLAALVRYVEGSHAKLLGLVEENSSLKRDLDRTETLFKATEAERARVNEVKDALQRHMRELDDALFQGHHRTSLLEGRLDLLKARYGNVEAERKQLVLVRDGLRQQIDGLEGHLESLAGNNVSLSEATARLKKRLAASETERLRLAALRDRLEGKVDALTDEVHDAATRTVILEEGLGSLSLDLNRALTERNTAALRRDRLDARVRELEEEVAAYQGSERAVLLRLTESTLSQMGELKRIVATAGLDVDELLRSAVNLSAGQGGPFVAYPSTSFVEEDAFEATVAGLDFLIDQWEDLQELLGRLPLVAPSDSYYVSSRFGKRRDPITRKPAMHYGVDLAGVKKTPVLTTAPGVVAFVGRNGRFGKLVEVDHGMGIRTRYGHLHKILVKKGQRVGHREKIGLLGNTGRSTGPHIHYEILVNGVPVDPLKFIKAGKHVFKG